MIFSTIKCSMYHEVASFFPWFKRLIFALIPKESEHKRSENQRLSKEKLTRRMNHGGERPDLIEGLLRNKDELGLTFSQLQGNSTLLIIAGSETTATLLSGITYLLGIHTDALANLTEEIRTTFKSEDEIDFVSVSNLPYLVACLEEALRIYPPAPLGLIRQVPKGGGTVAGHYVPEDVGVHSATAFFFFFLTCFVSRLT